MKIDYVTAGERLNFYPPKIEYTPAWYDYVVVGVVLLVSMIVW